MKKIIFALVLFASGFMAAFSSAYAIDPSYIFVTQHGTSTAFVSAPGLTLDPTPGSFSCGMYDSSGSVVGTTQYVVLGTVSLPGVGFNYNPAVLSNPDSYCQQTGFPFPSAVTYPTGTPPVLINATGSANVGGDFCVGGFGCSSGGTFTTSYTAFTFATKQCTSAANACGVTASGYQDIYGACHAASPSLPANYGQSCTSSANTCGQVSYGTVQCNGTCSATVPAVPASYGKSCTLTSAPNACGQTTSSSSGTYNCSGQCVGTPPAAPALPVNYGTTCTSAANACGQTNAGTIQCNGSCSAATPANSSCPAPVATLSATTPIVAGSSATLTYKCTNASAGSINQSVGTITADGTSHTKTVSPSSTTAYTLTCTGYNGGTATAQTTVTVAAPPDLTAGSVSPTSATVNVAKSFIAAITNNGGWTTGNSFTNLFQFDNDSDHNTVYGTQTVSVPTLAAGASANAQVSYTFPTTGTWYARACADNNASWQGTVTESSESNNCGGWTTVSACVSAYGNACTSSANSCDQSNAGTIQCDGSCSATIPSNSQCGAPTVTIAADSPVDAGRTSSLTWNATNAFSCTATNFATGGETIGQVYVTVSTTTTYGVTCTGYNGGTASASKTVIAKPPNLTAGTTSFSPVSPALNTAVHFSATVSNTGTGTAYDFPNVFQIANSGMTATIAMVEAEDVTHLAPNATSNITGSYTFNAGGTYNVRACANEDINWGNSVTESNSGDNCGPWVQVQVAYSSISGVCSVSPSVGLTGDAFTWQARDIVGGSGSYTYSWSGTDGLTGSGMSVTKSYSTEGQKSATVTVTSGSASLPITCTTPSGATYVVVSNSPTALLTATPAQILKGGASQLSWTSTNASSCSGTNFSTGGATSGTVTVSPGATTQYAITCTNSVTNAYSSATVLVSVADLSITALPATVRAGEQVNLTWAASGTVDSCSVTGPGVSASGVSGSQRVTVNASSIYTLSCVSGSITKTATAAVNLVPKYLEF